MDLITWFNVVFIRYTKNYLLFSISVINTLVKLVKPLFTICIR